MTFRADRLLKVAQALRESEAPQYFDMYQWGIAPEWAPESPQAKRGCGTPACAFGHYASRRDLQRAFKLGSEGDVFTREGGVVCSNIFEPSAPAIVEHFGISGYEAELLFGGNGCVDAKTTKGAAQYIERFVARKLKEVRK